MYIVLIACQFLLVPFIFANPFHKYPYVFLLDIGNEELEKTNTEQIRVSVPGGSLALRYPAVGNGDTISHVRVSGIDFGTDLKANVVDGGPGSKYVVIVFEGNQGTPYDAVMTIQTVSDEDINSNQNTVDSGYNYDVVEDNNDSAEDTNDFSTDNRVSPGDRSDLDSQDAGNTNAEIRQSSINEYSYVNRVSDDENSDEDMRQPDYNGYSFTNNDFENENENEDTSSNKDIYKQYDEVNQETNVNEELDLKQNQYQVGNERDSYINNGKSEPSQVEPEHSDFSDDYGNEDNDKGYNTDKASKFEYTKYQSLTPKLYDGVRIYPQNAVPFALSGSSYSGYNSEDPNEVDQTFNDEELHNSYNKDSNNNNFFDSDDASAVES